MHATLIVRSRPAVRACLWMVLALTPLGCATRQQLLEMETEFKTRMTKMEAGLATEKGRVDQLTTQLAAVRATATEATRIGTEATRIGNDARQRADAAAAKGDAVDGRLTRALANRLTRTPVQEFRVTFETGRAELSSPAEQALQGAVKLLADNGTYTADVVGHTDDVGEAGSNVNLSWRREEVVRRFMVEKGAALNRFSFIGLGEDRATATSAAGRAQDRYVHVIVFRPAD
jgi:outer membrane protein OmpA-like peptidoglycan-associated protein